MSDGAIVLRDPGGRTAVVLRPPAQAAQVIVHGFQGPPSGASILTGGKGIAIVETAPAPEDQEQDILYITTT